jgi:glycosyltransferase involved in cell wall biosynthesis
MAPVSVVIPCFRCVTTIGSAVASVAAQSLRPTEVLLVDDCSGDGTLAALHELASLYPDGWIRVISLPENMGPSGARNLGWDSACQPWIAFLDADDTWHAQKLELQFEVIKSDPIVSILGHKMNVQDRMTKAFTLAVPFKVDVVCKLTMLLTNPFQTSTVLLRRDLPFRFDKSRQRSEDFFLWAQIVLSGYRGARIDQALAAMYKPPFGAGGLSGDLRAMYAAGSDARRTLYRMGFINLLELALTCSWARVRYVRRCVLTFWRRWSDRKKRIGAAVA